MWMDDDQRDKMVAVLPPHADAGGVLGKNKCKRDLDVV